MAINENRAIKKGAKIAPQGGAETVDATANADAPKTVAPELKKQAPVASKGIDLRKQGSQILAAKSDEEIAELGSRSKDVAFVALLTNPWRNVTRQKNKVNAPGEETVGMRIKNVSDKPINAVRIPNKSYEVMDADFEKTTELIIAPGETVDLNSIEVGWLASQDDFCSIFSGGEHKVKYTPHNPKPGSLPTTKFLLAGGGSIKDFPLSIGETSADGKTRTIKPEFEEHFGIFATRGQRKGGSAGRTTKKPQFSPSALAVQELFKAKLGNK